MIEEPINLRTAAEIEAERLARKRAEKLDIIKRLRSYPYSAEPSLRFEAADEIERLRIVVATLSKMLATYDG